jgi:hypothetical protein
MLLEQLQTSLFCFSFKEGKEISPNNDRIQIVTDKAEKGFYELVIADVLPEDAGKYSCTAANKYGEVSCEAIVTVTSKLMPINIAVTSFNTSGVICLPSCLFIRLYLQGPFEELIGSLYYSELELCGVL